MAPRLVLAKLIDHGACGERDADRSQDTQMAAKATTEVSLEASAILLDSWFSRSLTHSHVIQAVQSEWPRKATLLSRSIACLSSRVSKAWHHATLIQVVQLV